MGIYVNRVLNLKKIKAIGLDMDYTLVRYNTEAFEHLTYQMAREGLITRKGYPKDIMKIDFDFKRAIRGLIIDEEKGNLIKLSLYGRIKQASHGTRLLDDQSRRRTYGGEIIELGEKLYTPIDTSFSISHGVLFAALVDLKDQNPKFYPPYEEMAQDVLEAIDFIHRNDSLKNCVTDRLEEFVIQDERTVRALETFKKSGKTIFLVTNSDYAYTQKLLDYAINPFLKDHSHWRELFGIVVTSANKPRFFTSQQNFLKIDEKNPSQLLNVKGELTPGIFMGGNSRDLQKYFELASDEILYLGDHIYGDILALKKQCGWRTALIVEEIDHEVAHFYRKKSSLEKMNRLVLEKEEKEDQLNEMIDRGEHQDEMASLSGQLEKIDKELERETEQYHTCFNPYWGEVMRAGAEESRFAGQVGKYACIYMAKVSDLADVSPRKYFRPRRRTLPHEM